MSESCLNHGLRECEICYPILRWLPIESAPVGFNGGRAIIWSDDSGVEIASNYGDEAEWQNDCGHLITSVTHWMPLPEPPK